MNLLEEPKPNNNNELIKHTAAVHIKSNLSLVDRKIVNILLKNAYETISSAKYHSIRLCEIKNAIGWKSKNYNNLKKSLGKLATTKIEWNIFKKDKKNIWATSSLLASASISGGKCIYDYSYHLRELFKNPNIYGKINLVIQNNFKSKYSLILWEFLTDYLAVGGKDGVRTEWIKMEDYKNLLGVELEKYQSFKALSLNLIKLPLEEINTVSDIEVEAIYQKNANRVSAVSFCVKKKVNTRLEKEPEKQKNIESNICNKTCETLIENVKEDLRNFCKISPSVIQTIIAKYDVERISENLKYVKSENSKGLIKNLAAYSYNCIKNDYRLVAETKINVPSKIELPEAKKIIIKNDDPSWIKLLDILKVEIDEDIFDKWIKKLNFVELENDKLLLAAEDKFQRDWISREYVKILEKSLHKKINIISMKN